MGVSLEISSCVGQVLVWDLEGLAEEHALPQGRGSGVRSLACGGGGVVAAVGTDAVVWGP
jgi:hypothetical protein